MTVGTGCVPFDDTDGRNSDGISEVESRSGAAASRRTRVSKRMVRLRWRQVVYSCGQSSGRLGPPRSCAVITPRLQKERRRFCIWGSAAARFCQDAHTTRVAMTVMVIQEQTHVDCAATLLRGHGRTNQVGELGNQLSSKRARTLRDAGPFRLQSPCPSVRPVDDGHPVQDRSDPYFITIICLVTDACCVVSWAKYTPEATPRASHTTSCSPAGSSASTNVTTRCPRTL